MSLLLMLSLVGLIVFITHTLEAITGFGCTVLAFPFVIAIMGDLERAKIVLSILAWILAGWFVITKFKHIYWKQFGIIVLLAGLGMPVGMFIFKSLDAVVLKKILGGFIVVSATIQLVKIYRPGNIISTLPAFFSYILLFLGGIVHGAFAVGGPLIVLYSAHKIPDKGSFRATMCLLWTTLNTVLILQYLFERKLTGKIGIELSALLPFLFAGIVLGEIIHNKVSEVLFKKIVFISLLLVGTTMVIIS
jgi:uncharacterized protein